MRGRVLFWRDNTDKPGGFGFIVPEGNTLGREGNYWFGPKALKGLNGLTVTAGDYVEFDVGDYKPGKGPQAARITALLDDDRNGRDHVMTLEGIDDVF